MRIGKEQREQRQQMSYRLTLMAVLLILLPLTVGASIAAFTAPDAFRMLDGMLDRIVTVATSMLAGYSMSRSRR